MSAPPVLRAVGPETGHVAKATNWQELGARRLAWMAALCAVLGVVGGLVGLLRQPNVGVRAGTERPLALTLVWAGLAALVWLLARSPRVPPLRRLDVGLGFLVVTSFLGGLYRHWLPYAESDVVRGVSPVALAVVFFAAVIPVPPRRMLVAAIAAGLMDALALALVGPWLDQPTPPWNLWLWLLMPDVFVVFVAVVTSRFLHRLAETVRRVRDMGAYRLVDELGAGGMGEVWRAEHRGLARPAAIKLIRAELLGTFDVAKQQRLLTRFEREAKATAALTSPHTIAVYDFGRTEDGGFYYVMELLDGMDLETLVARHGRLPPERAVYLLLQVCDSLADAHARGLVHRDIKPANVMVCRQGSERDFVKVLDFGLVKIETDDEELADEAKLTAAGAPLGTPAYMAPEVARGEEASAAADVYAFGCLAHWLLAGQLVFPHALKPMPQILAHTAEEPPRLDELVPGVSEALASLVRACLEKDVAERPNSMEVVRARLLATGLAEGWSRTQSADWWSSTELEAAPAEAAATDTAMADTVDAAVADTAVADTAPAE